jgi:hypothetical protein
MSKNKNVFEILSIINRTNNLIKNGFNIYYEIFGTEGSDVVIKFYFDGPKGKIKSIKYNLNVIDCYNNETWEVENLIESREWELAETKRKEELYASALSKLTKEELQTLKKRI